jgi:hypothetical protein
MKTIRTYVSSHVYQTPSGAYYDDRKVGAQRRLTNRRGAAAATSRERMKARVRDEDGKLGFKRVSVNTDIRKKGTKHTGSPDNEDLEADTVYEPEINEELASRYIARKLNQEEPDYDHFNITITGAIEA